MSTKYYNQMLEKHNESVDLSEEMHRYVKRLSLILNVSGIVIDFGVLTYFVVAFKRINDYYIGLRLVSDREDYSALNEEINYFIGYMMIASASTIMTSYLFLRKSFSESTKLIESDYKRLQQNCLLIIVVAYVLRAFYSIFFEFWHNQIESRFYRIAIQILANFIMDLPIITTTLLLYRKSIQLRK